MAPGGNTDFTMKFIVRIFWTMTALGCLIALFYHYGHVRQILQIPFLDQVILLSRSAFFFAFLGIFSLLNLLLVLFMLMIPAIPNSMFFVPRRSFWTQNRDHRNAANMIIANGLAIVGVWVNYLLIFWIMWLGSENHYEGSRNENINFFQWPALIFGISMIFPIVRFWVKNPNLLAQRDRV